MIQEQSFCFPRIAAVSCREKAADFGRVRGF